MLLALLKGVTKDQERIPVLDALANCWDPAAEPELAKLLGDASASRNVQLYAALPLIMHGKDDYRDVMLQWTAKADHAEKVRWYELLSDPRHKARKGIDPHVIRLGFKLIQADRAKTPDYIHAPTSWQSRPGPISARTSPPTRVTLVTRARTAA